MKKIITWCIYIKNIIRLSAIKAVHRGNISFKPKQLIGKRSSIEIEGAGRLRIEEKLFTQSDFHLKIVDGKCIIGKHCFFNHNCSVTCLEKISIGNRCTFGNNVVIVDHDHNIHGGNNEFICKPVIIKDNVWVGANAVILKGVTLGEGCVVAAGTVVTKDISPNMIYTGNYDNLREKKKG